MKNILFLALDFPEIGTANNLYADLMEEFNDNGHKTYVVASSLETGKEGVHIESGTTVLRVKTVPHQNVNLVKKGIANLLLPLQYLNAIKKQFKNITFDIIILPTPPITLAYVAEKLKKERNIPVYLILRDIFPQNAVDLGFIKKNGLIYNYFRRLEKKLYSISDKIGCMSQGNIDFIVKNNKELDPNKLHILRNWQQELDLTKYDKSEIIKEQGCENKFVIFFGGNISKPQKVENIIELAKLYRNNKNILFYIIGKGTEKKKLISLVAKNNLKNFVIKDFLPRDKYLRLIVIADVGLVSLDERFTIPNLPSKANSYFNAKIPVIALIDENTDFGTWIEDEIGGGYWSKADEPEKLKEKINLLIEDQDHKKNMGNKGYDYFVKNLNPNVAYKTVMKTIFEEELAR